MSDYLKKEWKKFRESVIESDGGMCVQCGRGEDEAVLQVHHKKYIKGRLPWQYGTKDCETLCKGCHAELHGHIKPRSGWDYLGDDDLGDLSGTCQNCGTSIRYVFHIGHEKWGFMEVGTHCCDNLTDTKEASDYRDKINKRRSRKKRFVDSPKWIYYGDQCFRDFSNHRIVINEIEASKYKISIDNIDGKYDYKSLEEAKKKAFDVIESGEFQIYLISKSYR